MKKIVSFLIITFTLLIISNVERIVSCPSGYSQDTVTITAGNCDYYVEVCYKCELTNPGKVQINKVWLVDSTCSNSLAMDLVLGQIYSEISDGAFILANFCPDGLYSAPPCGPESYVQYVIKYSYCWQIWNRWNGSAWVDVYWPCDDNASCEETINVCWDDVKEEYITTRNVSLTSAQSPPCDLQWFEITMPSQGNKSDCFILNSVPCGIAQP